MALSRLQKFILKQCMAKGGKVALSEFVKFYPGEKHRKNSEQIHKVIRKSVDRLIVREFISGYGSKTTRKLYIKEVRLTPKGRRAAKELMPKQQQIPL